MQTRHPPLAWPALLLSLLFIVGPGMGVPSELLLQDTFKSMVVAVFTLMAALLYVVTAAKHGMPLRWLTPMALPAILCLYALLSMVWSHTYLAGVEAARWLMVTTLFWVAHQVVSRDPRQLTLWGIHWGITIASVWVAAQFWLDFRGFPQGPQPASTFINRNFFAEYAVCALPYSFYLLFQSERVREVWALAAIIAFNFVAILMTGTRSAFVATLLIVPIAIVILSRGNWVRFTRTHNAIACFIFCFVFGLLGSLPGGNAAIYKETGTQSAIARASQRLLTLADLQVTETDSLSMRAELWRATLQMIEANPLTGVGAGAWEVQVPLYQSPKSQMEIDYFAHNEPLQLIAEYGFVGWFFLLGLAVYFCTTGMAVFHAWRNDSASGYKMQASAWLSGGALILVGCVGFPLHMAMTVALFAVSLALMRPDRINIHQGDSVQPFAISKSTKSHKLVLLVCSIMLVATAYVTRRAVSAEWHLVRSLQTMKFLANSPSYRNMDWRSVQSAAKTDAWLGMEANDHYRKLTAEIGDAFARTGDWETALAIWKRVNQSRPFIVTLICNIGRAHAETGQFEEAHAALQRAKSLRPDAPAVASLELLLLLKERRFDEATGLGWTLSERLREDRFLTHLAFQAGKQTGDWRLMELALMTGLKYRPEETVESLLQLGALYADPQLGNDPDKARKSFNDALDAVPSAQQAAVRSRIPKHYQTH